MHLPSKTDVNPVVLLKHKWDAPLAGGVGPFRMVGCSSSWVLFLSVFGAGFRFGALMGPRINRLAACVHERRGSSS